MKTKASSIALLFLKAMIWGFAFVAQVEGVQHVGSFTMNGLRYPLGALSLLPVMLILERGKDPSDQRRRTFYASLTAGTVLFWASTAQQLGIEYTGSAGVSGFITGLYTVFVPIACYIFFKKKTGINVLIGAICAVVGLAMLCYRSGEGLSFGLGELLLLVGTFFWTAHIVIIDKMGKDIRPLHFSFGQFVVCSVWSVITMLSFDTLELGGIISAAPAILYCGVLSVGVAYTLQVISQRKADPTFAAIVLSTESVFSAIGGVIFGIDKISLIGYIGCILIFAGIVFSQVTFKKRSEQR